MATPLPNLPSTATTRETVLRSRWLAAGAGVLFLGVALAYAWLIVFSRSMSPDEGYLMITIQSFLEGQPLYDSVFTHYGPFYFFYQWIIHVPAAVPLTHDATRILCVIHWLTASAILGLTGAQLMRSAAAGIFVFALAVLHLTALASEPGHPQEWVALLLALGLWAATRTSGRCDRWALLGLITALLIFTKINVGLFFGLAVLLAMRCQTKDRFAGGDWDWLLLGACAALPFLLMRQHLAAEWCQNLSLITTVSIAATLLLAQSSRHAAAPGFRAYGKVVLGFVLASLLLITVLSMTGTSWPGLFDGLLLNPLKMPGVALLPLPLPNAALLNAALALAAAGLVRAQTQAPRRRCLVLWLKAGFGLFGSLCLIGEAKAQFIWLLPWVWIVMTRSDQETERNLADVFTRLLIGLTASWQSLQAYPIAGTQVTLATFPLVLAYVICLHDVLKSAAVAQRLQEILSGWVPRRRSLAQALGTVAFLCVFANSWCDLPNLRQHHASLPALDLPGSKHVRFDAETTAMYRTLAQYLEKECDTFVTYPGINSLYFWSGKRPPTHLNSTGWGQLSHPQQEHILGALRQSRRPLLVVVASAARSWTGGGPEPIRPLVHCAQTECREVTRIGRFIILAPRPATITAQRDEEAAERTP